MKTISNTAHKAKSIILLCACLCIFPNPFGFAAEATPSSKVGSGKEIRIPVQAELHRYMLATKRFLEEQNFEQAKQYLARAQKLGTELPPSYFFFNGKVLGHEKKFNDARMSFEEYVLRSNKDSEYYIESLEMITQLENIPPQTLDEQLIKPELSWEIKSQPDNNFEYLEEITKLYLSPSAKEGLIQHINTLLANNPYTGTRLLVKNTNQATIKHSISVNRDQKITVQKTQVQDGVNQLMSFNTSAYGLSREFLTQCDPTELKCSIKHKDTLNTWFEIANDEAAANEIAEAASALILLLQNDTNAP